MEHVLIGTAILWGLTAVFVVPLTHACTSRHMAAEGAEVHSLDGLPDAQKRHWESVATGYYILWDVIVLAIAGFVGGLLGFYFIGLSLEAKGWPGMIAFVGASFLGLFTVGPAT